MTGRRNGFRRRVTLFLSLLCLPLAFPAAAGPLPPGGTAPPAENSETLVLGLSFRGRHRAYPLKHFAPARIVNDLIRQQEIAVYHNSDIGLSAAYFRTVLGEPIEFSGDVTGAVAVDMTTITRWDMETGKAVGGNLMGMELVPLPVNTSPLEEWLAAHPDTTVFSPGDP